MSDCLSVVGAIPPVMIHSPLHVPLATFPCVHKQRMRIASPLVQGAKVFTSSPRHLPRALYSKNIIMATLKRVVVTGGNKGIGFSNIEAMLARGDTYAIMGSRDLARGNAAKDELLKINEKWADKLEARFKK